MLQVIEDGRLGDGQAIEVQMAQQLRIQIRRVNVDSFPVSDLWLYSTSLFALCHPQISLVYTAWHHMSLNEYRLTFSLALYIVSCLCGFVSSHIFEALLSMPSSVAVYLCNLDLNWRWLFLSLDLAGACIMLWPTLGVLMNWYAGVSVIVCLLFKAWVATYVRRDLGRQLKYDHGIHVRYWRFHFGLYAPGEIAITSCWLLKVSLDLKMDSTQVIARACDVVTLAIRSSTAGVDI